MLVESRGLRSALMWQWTARRLTCRDVMKTMDSWAAAQISLVSGFQQTDVHHIIFLWRLNEAQSETTANLHEANETLASQKKEDTTTASEPIKETQSSQAPGGVQPSRGRVWRQEGYKVDMQHQWGNCAVQSKQTIQHLHTFPCLFMSTQKGSLDATEHQ